VYPRWSADSTKKVQKRKHVEVIPSVYIIHNPDLLSATSLAGMLLAKYNQCKESHSNVTSTMPSFASPPYTACYGAIMGFSLSPEITSEHIKHLKNGSSGTLRRVALARTDVSEELSASFIGVTRIGELGWYFFAACGGC
jgi:hypothetical protein